MKKFIARTLLFLVFCFTFWELVLEPCIDMYNKHGVLGVGLYLVILVLVGFAIWGFISILDWCVDNA